MSFLAITRAPSSVDSMLKGGGEIPIHDENDNSENKDDGRAANLVE